MKLSVGPILYLWERKDALAFYQSLCDAPVDIVYLGEVVCSKRRVLAREDWPRVARDLRAAGKQVVYSTLTLIEAESELATLARIVEEAEDLVEANDYACVESLAGRPFVAGPHLNVYNAATLELLARRGARRWAAPVELPLATIVSIAGAYHARSGAHPDTPPRSADEIAGGEHAGRTARPDASPAQESIQAAAPEPAAQQPPASATRLPALEVEVFAYGRLPLAFSARCFTARAHDRPKDDCGFVCGQYPDGITLYTREDQPFLTLNGIQTQSAAVQNLLPHVPALRAAGVDVLRLSPQSHDFLAVVQAFRASLDASAAPVTMPAPFLPGGYCDGYLDGEAGIAHAGSAPRAPRPE